MKSESGFTLVELMIVMVVLGILLAIAVPSYLVFQERARHGLAEGNVRRLSRPSRRSSPINDTYGRGRSPPDRRRDQDHGRSATARRYCIEQQRAGQSRYVQERAAAGKRRRTEAPARRAPASNTERPKGAREPRPLAFRRADRGITDAERRYPRASSEAPRLPMADAWATPRRSPLVVRPSQRATRPEHAHSRSRHARGSG